MVRTDPNLGAFCHAICRTYRIDHKSVKALDNVDKEFPRGALTVIAGPSGSGKSSLLRILACVERPDSGSIEIGGQSVANVTARYRRRLRRYTISYIFQDPVDNLIEYLNAAEQVRMAARLRGQRVTDAEIDAIFADLNLAHRRDHGPHQLSGGEQQRVSIACSMVGDPAVVVADEPTAELDSAAAVHVLDGVRVSCERGAAFVIASHDPRVIERADHLLMLDHGRVAQSW
ncbi:MAG TPA: ATP-binding cassette domain-containing protein [Jatrophihabitantaceae bacterium]|jgi:ABC-type lipoprotein export system ATPase subunit